MVFQCINIRQVPWEVLKTAASGLGFQHLPRDLANVNDAWKTIFDPYNNTRTDDVIMCIAWYRLPLIFFFYITWHYYTDTDLFYSQKDYRPISHTREKQYNTDMTRKDIRINGIQLYTSIAPGLSTLEKKAVQCRHDMKRYSCKWHLVIHINSINVTRIRVCIVIL